MPAIRTGNEVTVASISASTFPINRKSLRNAIRISRESSSTGSAHSDAVGMENISSHSLNNDHFLGPTVQAAARVPVRKPSESSSKSLVPVYSTLPDTITVNGKQLKPTVAFDTFWRFAAERKNIDDRRRAGQSAPWTDDPILQKYYFCNTYRVLDKLCQYMIREVIEKGPQDPTEIVFRVLLFNSFTKIETWELLNQKLGPLTWATYDRQRYNHVLAKAKSNGMTLYTGAFIKPAPHFGYTDNYMNHLCLLEVFMENQLAFRLLNAPTLADVYEYIISFPSMGDFTTYQLMLNLSYTKVLNFNANDFVISGPGSSSGLSKMFGKTIARAKGPESDIEVDVIRWLVETQDQHFERLGINFSRLGPKKLPMDVADVEHTLCEVDKYCRLAHPHLKGRRTEIRRNFSPSEDYVPMPSVVPKAWSDSARRVSRIRADQKLVVEKRYEVDRLGGHRKGPNGLEFHVFWLGYPKSDATWEPELSLASDAPVIVKEYKAAKGL